eukprot:1983015-Amphidinium_carterae.1
MQYDTEEHQRLYHDVLEVPLLHVSRTQSTIALSSAKAELYAMGQATIESRKAVASRLGLNRKTKHVQLKFLYILPAATIYQSKRLCLHTDTTTIATIR